MKNDKFERLSKRFPFLNEIVESISCSKINIDETINHIDKIEVQQVGFKILSRSLINEYWYNKSVGGTEEDHYDYESLFVVFDNNIESRGFSRLEHDYGIPIASFFTEVQPKYLVVVRVRECDWHHYYDRIGGRDIDQLKIKIFRVDRNIISMCKEMVNRFWERSSF